MTASWKRIPLTLVLLLVSTTTTSASHLRSSRHQHENNEERSLIGVTTLGCPPKACLSLAAHQAIAPAVLDTALCLKSGDCEYGVSCVRYVGEFMCINHAQNKGAPDVCALDCVEEVHTQTLCGSDHKTCTSLATVLMMSSNPNTLMASAECTQTQHCANGECRYDAVKEELKCDVDTSRCSLPCVNNEAANGQNRNIAIP